MKVVVTIPVGVHADLLGKCDVRSQEFKLLKNGIIDRNSDERGYVKILCTSERAAKILALAETFSAAAASQITITRDASL